MITRSQARAEGLLPLKWLDVMDNQRLYRPWTAPVSAPRWDLIRAIVRIEAALACARGVAGS